MPKLRFRIRFNEGRKGVPLEKLERIAAETRKFLEQLGADIELPDVSHWFGSDFGNASLSYDIESGADATDVQQSQFEGVIASLTAGHLNPNATESTAAQFYKIGDVLDSGDHIKFGLPQTGKSRLKWFILEQGMSVPDQLTRTDVEYFGSVQGILHSWYKESEPAYFYLRELSSEALIKCKYSDDSVYDALAKAVQNRRNSIHVHGKILANRKEKRIDSVDVDRLVFVPPFTMRDVDAFIPWDKMQ
jgi:hypothetical protein